MQEALNRRGKQSKTASSKRFTTSVLLSIFKKEKKRKEKAAPVLAAAALIHSCAPQSMIVASACADYGAFPKRTWSFTGDNLQTPMPCGFVQWWRRLFCVLVMNHKPRLSFWEPGNLGTGPGALAGAILMHTTAQLGSYLLTAGD